MTIIVLRTILVYIILFFAIRIMGKRQLGELQPSELVVTLLISELITLPINDREYPVINSIVAIIILIFLEIAVSALMLKIPLVQKMVSGRPKIIAQNGELDLHSMKENRLTVEDLFQALRSEGIFDIRDAEYILLEGNGQISVAPAKDEHGEDQHSHMVIITDGRLCTWGMELCGIDKKWIDKILKNEKTTIKNVLLMTANSEQDFHIVEKSKKKEAKND